MGNTDESVAEDEEDNVELDEIFEEVEELERTVFGEEKLGARKKEKASNY